MTKGSVKVETDYDETIVATNLNAINNINIKSGNDYNYVNFKLSTNGNIKYYMKILNIIKLGLSYVF